MLPLCFYLFALLLAWHPCVVPRALFTWTAEEKIRRFEQTDWHPQNAASTIFGLAFLLTKTEISSLGFRR